jgi:hypothetical protein
MDYQASWQAKEEFGDRQDRQQWPLRAGEHPLLDQKTEHGTYQETTTNSKATQVPPKVSRCSLCGQYTTEVFPAGNEFRTDSETVGRNWQEGKRKARVWDIINAGPLHRFTVQGILVHNCVDYADLFADLPGHKEKRDQIDANWKHMKAISQEFHCCVLTATQAKAESYSAYTLNMRHFSDDKRKNAHVDGIIGINQTDDEKVAQVARWNWIVRRNADFSPGRFLHVAECRPLANVCVLSKWDY